MRNKLVWAALFGLLITLVTGTVQGHSSNGLLGSSSDTFVQYTVEFGIPAQYIENHYMFVVQPPVMTVYFDDGTNRTVSYMPSIGLNTIFEGKRVTNFVVNRKISDYPDFTVQVFRPLDFVFNWLFFSFVMLLLLGGWRDLKGIFKSVDSKNIASRLFFILAVMFFAAVLLVDVLFWLSTLIWGLECFFLSMTFKYYANEQVQEEKVNPCFCPSDCIKWSKALIWSTRFPEGTYFRLEV